MKIKPTIANGAIHDFAEAFRKVLVENYPFKTCLNCVNFKEDEEICKLAKTRPPARVIAFGCPKFSDDKIPY